MSNTKAKVRVKGPNKSSNLKQVNLERVKGKSYYVGGELYCFSLDFLEYLRAYLWPLAA